MMKRVLKLVSVLCLALVLTGCMKVDYQIKIVDEDNATASATIMYAKETLESMGVNVEDALKDIRESDDLKDWTSKDVSQTIDDVEYVGVALTANDEAIKEILQSVTIKNNECTLELGSNPITKDIEESVAATTYTAEQMKSLGLDATITITMPGSIKSASMGAVNKDQVKIDLIDINGRNDLVIVSEVDTSLDILPIIAVVAAVAVVLAIIFAIVFRKKKDNNEPSDSNNSTGGPSNDDSDDHEGEKGKNYAHEPGVLAGSMSNHVQSDSSSASSSSADSSSSVDSTSFGDDSSSSMF